MLIYQTISHLGMFDGEIETDESYFGGARKGNLGISDVGKAAIFWFPKRNSKFYTVTIPNTQSDTRTYVKSTNK